RTGVGHPGDTPQAPAQWPLTNVLPPFDEAISRATVTEAGGTKLRMATPEDLIVDKADWPHAWSRGTARGGPGCAVRNSESAGRGWVDRSSSPARRHSGACAGSSPAPR